MRIVLNPSASRSEYTAREKLVISRALAQDARCEISQWPEYAPTPLRNLDSLTRKFDLGALYYKDESGRLGQGSFKILGGAYAATLKLAKLAARESVTLCCATDGNHGRSVAFAAERHGCACVVFMHEHAPKSKEQAIAALGARVLRVAGTYDDSIRLAQKTAAENGWVLVADTSDDPLDLTTRHVIQGYGVMALEVVEQLQSQNAVLTHVFLQAGVGGFAAAIAAIFAESFGSSRPRVIVVEPEAAACVLESALRGRPSKVGGDLRTAMGMLSTGEASPVAWPILERRAEAFTAIDDSYAVAAAAELTGLGLSVGVSGAAGFGGLLALLDHPEAARILGIDTHSRVLLFGTEQAPPSSED
jgi:diaminopropionate ammonia-lyase